MERLETSMPAAQNLYSANGFLRGFSRGLPPTFLQLQWIRLLANQAADAPIEIELRLLEPHADDSVTILV
jgi:hypothetical protein